MSAARVPVSFEEELSLQEKVSHFTFRASRNRSASAIELPQVVPASALVEQPAPATVLTGIEQLDALTGGLPRGALSEICGPTSSGRTSVLLAVMASMTGRGDICALVDATDSFAPKSAQAAGVDLRSLLWIRCSKRKIDGQRSTTSNQWPVTSGQRESQTIHRKLQMDSLAQALKTTDLLLQGGGFGLVVVDLGDVPAAAARRVPLTSWFRFRRAVENTETVLVVVEQEPYAKTCASVVLKLTSSRLSVSGTGASDQNDKIEPTHARILSGLHVTAEILRSGTQRKKPVQSVYSHWESRTAWSDRNS